MRGWRETIIGAWLLLAAMGAGMPMGSCAEEVIIQSIRIIGLERTRERVVLRQLPFAEGDVWQEDFSETGERWLRNLGLFSEVHITPPDAAGVVVIHVHERWSLWILPQLSRRDNGASSAGVALDEYNLWGLNHHLRLAYKKDTGKNFSSINGTSYEAGYDWRRILDSKLSLHLSGGRGKSIFDSYSAGLLVAEYLQHSNHLAVRFDYALGPVPGEGWGISLGYALNHLRYQLLNGPPQPDVLPSRRHGILAGIHYRQIDDQITWISGTAFDYELSITHSALGSTLNVYRHTGSLRAYLPIAGHNTLNLRLNAGAATGDVLRDGLFDLGNRNGIRGYFPGEVQTKSYALGTVEGRLLLHPDSNVQWVAFSDVGYLPNGRLAVKQRRWFIGAGTGLRWTLRWLVRGTLRADAAYGLVTRRWRFYLGTGQAF